MPRPYSIDLRERALLTCEDGGRCCTQTARQFRTGVSTLHLWRKQARNEGRRAPRPTGRGPAPLGGKLDVLTEIVAERNDATLAEYADLLAGRTGERRSPSMICRALKRLGWVRKQRRSGPASSPKREAFAAGIVWTWRPAASHGGPKPQASTRPASCSLTRAASTRA